MSSLSNDQMLAWVDVETFGLSPETDPILEISVRITDLDLNSLGGYHRLLWAPGVYDTRYKFLRQNADGGVEGDKYVLNLHTKNNLFDEARANGDKPDEIEGDLAGWLVDNNFDGLAMAGSSVRFDRAMLAAQMPEVEQLFHYRIIDSSSLKELCRRYNPTLYSKLPPKQELHRTEPDLDDTLIEFKFYRDEFLLW